MPYYIRTIFLTKVIELCECAVKYNNGQRPLGMVYSDYYSALNQFCMHVQQDGPGIELDFPEVIREINQVPVDPEHFLKVLQSLRS